MAAWPAGETSQSAKACASSVLTSGQAAGLTGITPYWLNSSGSPSTTIRWLPLFPKAIEVARSVIAWASVPIARVGVAPIPEPVSRYQAPPVSVPASDQSASSVLWVPLYSPRERPRARRRGASAPREAKAASAAAMAASAAAASVPPAIPAGS